MIALDITPAEVESGALAPAHRDAAVSALREDGIVVLNDVIDTGHLETLRERMLADLRELLARRDAPFNWNVGNVQQDPPPFPPYLFRDVLVNEMVIAVTKALLGPGLRNSYYSGNTSLPGGQKQPVHVDVGQLWPNLETATPAFGVVVNVPLVDMDERNGSTEVWPGTHRDTTVSIQRGDIKVPEEVTARRREIAPPLQPSVRSGSVLIRDIRLWHRGMPNQTETPRPMIAMIHWIHWWHAGDPVHFPKGTEAFFEHPDLQTHARFVDGPIDHIHRNQAYEYAK
jgi:Phytanoyl-CoA dioxygenase (PhyH)